VRGDIAMHCDADDLYPQGRIKSQVAWLQSHPSHIAVCGSYSTMDSKGKLIAHLPCGEEPEDISIEVRQGKLRTSLCTYAVRTEFFRKTGGFREYFESSYDIDMQLRLCDVGRIGYIPENLYFYRIHESSISHTPSVALREFL